MGYTTDFDGSFQINKPLSEKMKEFLTNFAETRRMARKQPDKFGIQGEFFVDGTGTAGQGSMPDVIDHNKPPSTQPGLWCQWVPNEDGTEIVWDGGEKFYYYTEWLVYLIHKILAPNGYVLNGSVTWQGEGTGDVGEITIKKNKVFIKPWKGKKEEKTPANCECYDYPKGKANFMATGVVFVLEKEAVGKKKKFAVEVVRISHAFKTIEVEATSQAEAEKLALDQAGDHEYSEKDAEYKVN